MKDLATINFVLQKSTKGAHKYAEVNPTTGEPIEYTKAKIGTLYIRKNLVYDPPEELEVLIRQH